MKIIPHDYQIRINEEILNNFKNGDTKVLLQSATGSGKTITFSLLAKHYVHTLNKKAIITCHKDELVDQTAQALLEIGISKVQKVFANTKKILDFADVYVCMVETLYNRLKSGRFKFENIGLFIADEAHILVHNKNYSFFKDSHILGVTATPVHTTRVKFWRCNYCLNEYSEPTVCCADNAIEWSKPFAFSSIYDSIVNGPPIREIIDMGQLVEELYLDLEVEGIDGLKVDSTGDFSSKSKDEVFGSDDVVADVLLNYKEHCIGKKTIIYNSNTNQNLKVYEQFVEAGIDCRLYDSVNSNTSERDDVVNWFMNKPDAVLFNVACFTTGLDVRDIQVVMLNTATMSLSLYLQMVGRGGRYANNIFKDHFLVLDFGGNLKRFGEWSADRDWTEIFKKGIGEERRKRENLIDIHDCPACGFMYPKGEKKCPNCGHEIVIEPPSTSKELVTQDIILKPIREIPPPNPKAIYEYTVRNNEGFAFALNVLYNRIVDMFRYYRVTKDLYLSTLKNGKFDKRINELVRPTYFYLINSDLKGANRKLNYVTEKTKEKIKRYYENIL